MPTKTKKPAAKRATPKKSTQSGFFNKLGKKLGGRSKPLSAIVIVAAVMAVGYFGYVYSSANADTNFAQQRQTCRTTFENKPVKRQECLAQVDKDQAAAQKEAALITKKNECTSQNRVAKDDGSCGVCKSGYFDKAGVCKPVGEQTREKMRQQCVDQNRVYVEKTNRCGDCREGYYQASTACARVRKADPADVKASCAAKFQKYISVANRCDDACIANYYLSQGACTAIDATAAAPVKALCATAHKNYDPATNSCATCAKGYAVQGDVCVKPTKAELASAQKVCFGNHLVFDTATLSCSTACVSGYVNNGTVCLSVSVIPAKDLQKLCEAQGQRYDKTIKTCNPDCRIGYEKTADGKCMTPAAINASCKAQFLQFNAGLNVCRTDCIANYVKASGKCIDSAEFQNVMSARLCRALGRQWSEVQVEGATSDAKTFECAPICLDPNQLVVPNTRDTLQYCKAADGFVGGVSLETSPADCAKLNRIYLKDIKACSPLCLSTYFKTAGACEPIRPQPSDLPSSCLGPLSSNKEICTTDEEQPATSPNENGILVSTAEYGIAEKTCTQLLGRVWLTKKDAKSSAGCSTQDCLAKSAQVRRANDSYYCERSVDRGIQKEQCTKLHRVWVDTVEACAARAHVNSKLARVLDAPQCAGKFSVYVYQRGNPQEDQCLTKNSFENIRSVANKTGKPLQAVARVGAKVFCNRQKGMEYVSGKCLIKRVTANPSDVVGNNNGSGNSNGNGGGSSNGGGGSDDDTVTVADHSAEKKACEALHRVWYSTSNACSYRLSSGPSNGLCQSGFAWYEHYTSSKRDECKLVGPASGTAGNPSSADCPVIAKANPRKYECKEIISGDAGDGSCYGSKWGFVPSVQGANGLYYKGYACIKA